jgi:hypothetical protein
MYYRPNYYPIPKLFIIDIKSNSINETREMLECKIIPYLKNLKVRQQDIMIENGKKEGMVITINEKPKKYIRIRKNPVNTLNKTFNRLTNYIIPYTNSNTIRYISVSKTSNRDIFPISVIRALDTFYLQNDNITVHLYDVGLKIKGGWKNLGYVGTIKKLDDIDVIFYQYEYPFKKNQTVIDTVIEQLQNFKLNKLCTHKQQD